MLRFATQVLFAACLLSWPVEAQFTQQAKLFAPDFKPGPLPEEGWSVAISADGTTALVSGPNAGWTGQLPNAGAVGATWVFVRSNGAWSEQAKLSPSPLPPNGYVGQPEAASGTPRPLRRG